jgi:hydrogenase nickel incorporation protein HypA/HybF
MNPRMHEYSIVQALFDQIDRSARQHRATAVHGVTVRIGELSGVECALLHSAYDLYRERTICAGAPLTIRSLPARWSCPGGHGDIARGAPLTCPSCGRAAVLRQGDEIVLDRLELEVPDV